MTFFSVVIAFTTLGISPSLTTESVRACFYDTSACQRSNLGEFEPKQIDPFLCSHIILTFLVINSTTFRVEYDDQMHSMINQALDLKIVNPKLKVLIAISAEDKDRLLYQLFEKNRPMISAFVSSVHYMLKKHDLDGFDVHLFHPSDKAHFLQLFSTLRYVFDSEKGQKRYMLTAAVTGIKEKAQLRYHRDTLMTLDLLFVKTFLYNGIYFHKTNLISPLSQDPVGYDMLTAVSYYSTIVAKQKIVVGFPFFGVPQRLLNESDNGVGARVIVGYQYKNEFTISDRKSDIYTLAYFEICRYFVRNKATYVADDDHISAYLYKDRDWVSLDSRQTICVKMYILNSNGFTGWAAWTVDMDDHSNMCGEGTFPLLKYLNEISSNMVNSDECADDELRPRFIQRECSVGKFGDFCEKNCSENCMSGVCSATTGECSCKDGYVPGTCNEICQEGFYGTNCVFDCGSCAQNDSCHHVTGLCPRDCEIGFSGQKCDPCPAGKFGGNCLNTCNCFKGFACDSISGNCDRYGCAPFWSGVRCDDYDENKCPANTWGKACTSCGKCKFSDCDKLKGHCSNFQCATNARGVRCDTCINGRYGRRCQHQCGHCQYMSCEQIHGSCSVTGCSPGYMGRKCDLQCRTGLWGYECEHECSRNCEGGQDCDTIDGTCRSGCKAGWVSLTCVEIETCSIEHDCPKYRSHNCKDGLCAKLTGFCTNGCKLGYMTPTCENKCHRGTYGIDCANDCGLCEDWTPCNVETGICDKGCMGNFVPPMCTVCPSGYFGRECDRRCGHCKNKQPCDSIYGSCLDGCEPGFSGFFCDNRISDDFLNFDL